jgi:hypothetical protein
MTGDRRAAMRLMQRSLDAGRALGARPEIARTYEALGRLLLEGPVVGTAPEDLDALRCFEHARTTYRSLALTADLARLESLEDPV